MNVETGDYGIHAVRLTPDGEPPWSINALMDFGPEHYASPPQLLAFLNVHRLRELRDQIDLLLRHPKGASDRDHPLSDPG